MSIRKHLIALCTALVALAPASAKDGALELPVTDDAGGQVSSEIEGIDNLAGRIFAVDAEVTFSLDPAFPAGTAFQNCYFFDEDGVWFDPLFPDFGIAVPGGWRQHTGFPKIGYTATVAPSDATFGLTLIQNGQVTPPPRGNGHAKLRAYTTVWVEALPVVEVLSVGRAVEECPYFDRARPL